MESLVGLLLVVLLLAFIGCMLRGAAAASLPAHRSKRSAVARRCFFAAGALALVVLIAGGARVRQYMGPERYLDDAERAAKPVIAAIDRFVAARGKAPGALYQLVPDFLAGIPPTECGPFQAWDYIGPQWVLHDEPNSWRLSVPLERFPLGHGSDERFEFNSWDRRWIYRR